MGCAQESSEGSFCTQAAAAWGRLSGGGSARCCLHASSSTSLPPVCPFEHGCHRGSSHLSLTLLLTAPHSSVVSSLWRFLSICATKVFSIKLKAPSKRFLKIFFFLITTLESWLCFGVTFSLWLWEGNSFLWHHKNYQFQYKHW